MKWKSKRTIKQHPKEPSVKRSVIKKAVKEVISRRNKTKIYFAAPFFTMAERLWNKEVATRLRNHGYDVFLPQESEANVAKEDEREIYLSDVKAIDESDIIVAVMDGSDPDSGTCWEHGYAVAKGKLVICIRTDFRRVGHTSFFNLMMEQSANMIVFGWDDNINQLVEQIVVSLKIFSRKEVRR